MEGWESFALAQVGASAALAGLVLVAVSVSLDRVLSLPYAPHRVAQALVALLALLLVGTALLIPDQPRWVLGIELLAIGLIDWVIIVMSNVTALRYRHVRRTRRANIIIPAFAVLGQLATLPFVVAGVVLLLGSEDGLYGVAVGAVGSFGVAFLAAWAVLIEIALIEDER